MLTMTVAWGPTPERAREVPLDVQPVDVGGWWYLALRVAGGTVLLSECEAQVLATALSCLSERATAPASARDVARNERREGGGDAE
jgi:hypothetical protein